MKSHRLLVYVLALSLLVFPAVGHAYSYEIFADETQEEVVRIVETKNERLLAQSAPNNLISFPKAFSVWKWNPIIQVEKPYVVSKKFLVLRVLRL